MAYLDVQHEIVTGLTAPAVDTVRVKENIDSTGVGSRLTSPTFGAAITIDLSTGQTFLIVASTNTNITIGAPTNVPNTPGLIIGIIVKNTSGGSMGTVTLNAAYKTTSTAPFATPPANGFNRWISFQNLGTQSAPEWCELTRGTADVAN